MDISKKRKYKLSSFSPNTKFFKKKRGQVTIFIIIAVILVAAVALFFVFKDDSILETSVPSQFQSTENEFLVCMEQSTSKGISVLESQGGYIELPEFEPGSEHMPFSSQLSFLGVSIPYWYYVSGNNVEKEQVPSEEMMEEQLGDYIEEEVRNCELSSNTSYSTYKGEDVKANVNIKDKKVKVDLNMDLIFESPNSTEIIDEHSVEVDSKLGSLYESALEIYEEEQENYFLEERGLDILHLYAPVEGMEMSCSPLYWNADEIFVNLSEAIQDNTLALNNRGKRNDYFDLDLSVSEEIRFFNSKDWPSTYEVSPADSAQLSAEPIGNQPGLGILGFCYVPYHFVYDLKYPVLVQISDSDTGEIFNFPMAVIIQGNNPRKSLDGEASSLEKEICPNKNVPVSVEIYDSDSNPVENARLFYECVGERCYIGNGSLIKEDFPECVNGKIIVSAEGYAKHSQTFSSNEGGSLSIYLDKLYDLEVDLKKEGKDYNGYSVINFMADDYSKTVVYPQQKFVELKPGSYDVELYSYEDASLEIGSLESEQCVEVPSGIGGVFGMTQEKCFETDIPEQTLSKVLSGGGISEKYFSKEDLEDSNTIELDFEELPVPESMEDLQKNYMLFEEKNIEVNLK